MREMRCGCGNSFFEYRIFLCLFLPDMIKYAIEHNFERYNFYGIPNTFDKNDKDYGIYEFKTGFNGFVEELIGEFEITTSPVYYLIKLIHKIRH